MEAKFINGSTVTRLWGDDATELLAAFAYEEHAKRFAELLIERTDVPTSRVSYLVYSHYNGKSEIVRDGRIGSDVNEVPKKAQSR